jgi:predicted nucleic acid-binding Zn ribbon protein
MERAGRILTRLQATRDTLPASQILAAAWPAAVGLKVAGHTRVSAFADGLLLVEVEDAMWQRNLEALKEQILPNLRRLLGDLAPRAIQYRVGGGRRMPVRREGEPNKGLFADPRRGAAAGQRQSGGRKSA